MSEQSKTVSKEIEQALKAVEQAKARLQFGRQYWTIQRRQGLPVRKQQGENSRFIKPPNFGQKNSVSEGCCQMFYQKNLSKSESQEY